MAHATLPQPLDLRLYRGDDFFCGFLYSERDAVTQAPTITSVTGWVATSQFRESAGGRIWLTLAAGSGLDLTVQNGSLVASMHVLGGQTSGVEWDTRTAGVWDLQVISPLGVSTTVFAGRVFIAPDVTRPVL